MILILLIWTMEVKPLAMMSPMFVDVIAHIVSGLFFKDNSSQFDVKNFNSGGGGNGSDFFKSVSRKNRIDDFDGPFSNALTKQLH